MHYNQRIENRRLLIINLFLLMFLYGIIWTACVYKGNELTEAAMESVFTDATKATFLLPYYLSAILTALLASLISRYVGLKKFVLVGIISSILAIGLLFFSERHWDKMPIGLYYSIIFICWVLLGSSIANIITSLNAYIVLLFREHPVFGITAFYAMFNIGGAVAPLLIDHFKTVSYKWAFPIFLIIFLIGSILLLIRYLFDPEMPRHIPLEKRHNLIWIEMHFRLVLFIFLATLYGLCEGILDFWGEDLARIRDVSEHAISEITFLFWFIIALSGSLFAVLVHFYSPRRIFEFCALLILVTFFIFPFVKTGFGFAWAAGLAGFSCAPFFPLIITFIEDELLHISKVVPRMSLATYLELGSGAMVASYFIGRGVINLLDEIVQKTLPAGIWIFIAGMVGALLMVILAFYVVRSRPVTKNF